MPETVYLGGGTPSGMAPEALRRLLDLIPGRPWMEATIEAAPGTVTAEKARAWAACGINRVSLGVQSFVTKEIRRTGRKHTAQTVADEIGTLRDAGIGNLNIDLIAGLSGQTEASWRESLDWIERLAPAHVSVYMLEVDEDSRLGKEILLGGARYGAGETPGDDRTAALYEMAVERLARAGHSALRDLEFRAAGLRIAPQSQVLETGAVRGLRRRRPFLRRARAPAESGIGRGVSQSSRPQVEWTCPTLGESASSSDCG